VRPVPSVTLVIGNKNYSSWSMRPWVLMRQLGIPFEELKLRFHSEEWARDIARWSPSGLVPVLWRGDQAVWDTLAIVETLAEWHPGHGIWPSDPIARGFARSLCAEMHSGFRELRTTMPMNIRASHPGKGLTAATRADIVRIEALWAEARRRFDVPLAAYQVSGEYSMLHAAFQRGWLDQNRAMLESLVGIRRAGADFIVTYFAKDAAKLLP